MPEDPITAMLNQLAEHAERIDRLDARRTGDAAAAATQIAALAALAGRLDGQVAALTDQLTVGEQVKDEEEHPYTPAPARRWWKLTGEDRENALAALRAWVEQVYRPGYGHLAAPVAACWDQHPLCLYAVDILAELWSVLYLTGTRTAGILSAQAEYQARIVPALTAQMSTETSRCGHARDRLMAPGQPRSPR